MSNIIRCDKGHYYDSEKFATCPHCGISIDKRRKNVKKEEVDDLDDMVTVAKNVFGGSHRKRKKPVITGEVIKPPKLDLKSEVTDEMLEVQELLKQRKEEQKQEDDQVTVRFEKLDNGIDPVVGWIVCISGDLKGNDYRLQGGFNRIGRSRDMDVAIEKDKTISRDTHCSIVYDGKSNKTFLVPGNGTLTYYKGELLREAMELTSDDEIEIGETKFVFVSFCKGERTW